MELSRIRFPTVRFPGRAGELQAGGPQLALIVELGDNYDVYHEHLRGELARALAGGRPDPANFDQSEDYFAACGRLEDLVKAEAFIRVCCDHRRKGHALDAPPNGRVPLLDGDDRLIRMP
jgi:hypothetical protein